MTKALLGSRISWWTTGRSVGHGDRRLVLFRVWGRHPAGRYAWDRMKLGIPIAGTIVLKATLARSPARCRSR